MRGLPYTMQRLGQSHATFPTGLPEAVAPVNSWCFSLPRPEKHVVSRSGKRRLAAGVAHGGRRGVAAGGGRLLLASIAAVARSLPALQ